MADPTTNDETANEDKQRNLSSKLSGGHFAKGRMGASTSELRNQLKRQIQKENGDSTETQGQENQSKVYDLGEGKSRTVISEASNNTPIEIHFKDKSSGYSDSWKKVPGTDVWVKYDSENKATGRSFEGDIKVNKDGTFEYKDRNSGEQGLESREGVSTVRLPQGAMIYRTCERVTDIDYGNSDDGAYVDYDENGKPRVIGGPIEILERQPDGSFIANNMEPPTSYDNVTIDNDGVITMYRGGKVVQIIDPKKDFLPAQAKPATPQEATPLPVPTVKTYKFRDSLSLTVIEDGDKVASQIHFTDSKTGFENTWKRDPNTQTWEQYDASGKATGQTMRGEFCIDESGLSYSDGARKQISYPNGLQAEIEIDTQGNPLQVLLPDGPRLLKKSSIWAAVDEEGKSSEYFSDVRLTSTGIIKVTDMVDNRREYLLTGAQVETHNDGSRLETDAHGRPYKITLPSPHTETITFDYQGDNKQPCAIDYGHGNHWLNKTGNTWENASTGEAWNGDVRVQADGTYSYHVEGTKEVTTQFPNGSRMILSEDRYRIETREGALITAHNSDDRIHEIEYPTGPRRTFEYTDDGMPSKINYENQQNDFSESWEKVGDEQWLHKDKNGNTIKSWQGDFDVDQTSGDLFQRDSKTMEVTTERADGSVIKSDSLGNITQIKRSDGNIFKVGQTTEDGTIRDFSDNTGHWASADGIHWANDKGQRVIQTVSLDEDGTVTTNDGVTKIYFYSSGARLVQEQSGGKRFYDEAGRLSETIDATSNVHKYDWEQRYPKITTPDGSTWTTSDGENWISQGDKKTFKGSMEVNEQDGTLTIKDSARGAERIFYLDGTQAGSAQPDSAEESPSGAPVQTAAELAPLASPQPQPASKSTFFDEAPPTRTIETPVQPAIRDTRPLPGLFDNPDRFPPVPTDEPAPPITTETPLPDEIHKAEVELEEAPVNEAEIEQPEAEEAPVNEADIEEPEPEEVPVNKAETEEPEPEEVPVNEAETEEPEPEEVPVNEAETEEPEPEETTSAQIPPPELAVEDTPPEENSAAELDHDSRPDTGFQTQITLLKHSDSKAKDGRRIVSTVHLEIEGTQWQLHRPHKEAYYFPRLPAANDFQSQNKLHVYVTDAQDLARIQSLLLPAFKSDTSLTSAIENWKTIDPRSANPNGRWDTDDESPPAVQARARTPRTRGFTIYIKNQSSAETVANRLNEILAEHRLNFDTNQQCAETMVGESNRISITRDFYRLSVGSSTQNPSIVIDDPVSEAIKSDLELAASARQNGRSVLQQLETELNLTPGTLHEEPSGTITLRVSCSRLSYERGKIFVADLQADAKGTVSDRKAIYAIYRKYGFDPKNFHSQMES